MTVTIYCPACSLHGSQFVTMLLKFEVPKLKYVILGVTCWAQSKIAIAPS